MTEVVCEGRYCPCRSHLNPDMPGWVLDAYMPSRWALETMHQIYLDRRTADQVTDDERAVFIGELGNLTDMAYDALREAK